MFAKIKHSEKLKLTLPPELSVWKCEMFKRDYKMRLIEMSEDCDEGFYCHNIIFNKKDIIGYNQKLGRVYMCDGSSFDVCDYVEPFVVLDGETLSVGCTYSDFYGCIKLYLNPCTELWVLSKRQAIINIPNFPLCNGFVYHIPKGPFGSVSTEHIDNFRSELIKQWKADKAEQMDLFLSKFKL